MAKNPFIYILASKRKGTLYIGVTSNLQKRIWEHREEVTGGFTKKYTIHRLVYYEPHTSMESAILREKDLKGWNRDWKIKLIEKMNPKWEDLFPKLNP